MTAQVAPCDSEFKKLRTVNSNGRAKAAISKTDEENEYADIKEKCQYVVPNHSLQNMLSHNHRGSDKGNETAASNTQLRSVAPGRRMTPPLAELRAAS